MINFALCWLFFSSLGAIFFGVIGYHETKNRWFFAFVSLCSIGAGCLVVKLFDVVTLV